MTDINQISSPKNSAREVVLQFIQALNEKDLRRAGTYISDEMKFEGVLGSREDAEAYFKDMERLQLQFNIKKVFEDGNDVCVLYDIHLSGTTVFGCGWYQVFAGKISLLRVVFDPRPLLATPK